MNTSSSGTRRTLFALTFQRCTSPQVPEPSASTYSKAAISPERYLLSHTKLTGFPGRHVGQRYPDSIYLTLWGDITPLTAIRAFSYARLPKAHDPHRPHTLLPHGAVGEAKRIA